MFNLDLRAVGTAAALLVSSLLPAQWQPAGTLTVPRHAYTFLATSPRGDLLAATFNGTPKEAQIPALLVRDPGSATPTVQELCRVSFQAMRGFGGIACDLEGNFFVTGDTGKPEDSFIAKFRPDGTPFPGFGQGGVVRPGYRCLGVTTIAQFVLVAANWGYVRVHDSATGRHLGDMAQSPVEIFMRDIAIDPRSLRVFGVGQAGVVSWGGGVPWDPRAYLFRQIIPGDNPPIVGEGITIDPFKRCVVISPLKARAVKEVYGDGKTIVTPITSVTDQSSLTDTAVSFDGRMLFVSDYTLRQIHVLKRDSPDALQAADSGYAASEATPAAQLAPVVNWSKSYSGVLQQARESKKPMLVYFRSGRAKPCLEFEKNILLTDAFNRQAQNMACVFEDADQNRLLAYQFGVTRVPHVVVFHPNGEVMGELRHPIDPKVMNDLVMAVNR